MSDSPSLFQTPEEWAAYQIEKALRGESNPGPYDQPEYWRKGRYVDEPGPEVETATGPLLEMVVNRIHDFQKATYAAEVKVKEAAEARGIAEALENQLRELIVEAYQADPAVRIFVQTSNVALKVRMES